MLCIAWLEWTSHCKWAHNGTQFTPILGVIINSHFNSVHNTSSLPLWPFTLPSQTYCSGSKGLLSPCSIQDLYQRGHGMEPESMTGMHMSKPNEQNQDIGWEQIQWHVKLIAYIYRSPTPVTYPQCSCTTPYKQTLHFAIANTGAHWNQQGNQLACQSTSEWAHTLYW